MLMIETLKERIEGFAGRVSATRVTLTVALPPPPTPQMPPKQARVEFEPLQAEAEKAASKRTGRRVLLRFI